MECKILQTKWDDLQSALELKFHDVSLLKQAFTHASYRNEHRRPTLQDNERLEFLGDAVLELVISEYLYQTWPSLPEGELTRMRATIVCEPTLATFATQLGFHTFVRLGRGEERSGGRNRPALLADVFEAFIGSLYVDGGLHAVQEFVNRHLLPRIANQLPVQDFKTSLQEWVQQRYSQVLRYQILEERGPAHAKEFIAQVIVGERVLGVGSGKSKKEAEQNAAGAALQQLRSGGGIEDVSETH